MIVDTPFRLVTVPKCACSTLRLWYLRRLKHIPDDFSHDWIHLAYHQLVINQSLPAYVFTRNPVSRIISMYSEKVIKPTGSAKLFNPTLSFEKMIDDMYADMHNMDSWNLHYRPQFLFAPKKIEGMFKIENNLQKPLAYICSVYGVPMTPLETRNAHNYPEGKPIITPNTMRKIIRIYKDDFEYGAYEKPIL